MTEWQRRPGIASIDVTGLSSSPRPTSATFADMAVRAPSTTSFLVVAGPGTLTASSSRGSMLSRIWRRLTAPWVRVWRACTTPVRSAGSSAISREATDPRDPGAGQRIGDLAGIAILESRFVPADTVLIIDQAALDAYLVKARSLGTDAATIIDAAHSQEK